MHNIKGNPVQKLCADLIVSHRILRTFIHGGDKPDIHILFPAPIISVKAVILYNPDQSFLRRRGQRIHIIQKQRPAIGAV